VSLFLQIWGGSFYLLNKILFSAAEGKEEATKKCLKIWGWSIYILGAPAWIILLMGGQSWMAASIEVGGIPAMVLGLYNTINENRQSPKLFNRFVVVCTYLSLAVGISYSLYVHSGLTSLSQMFELVTIVGFLLGSYYMAKNHLSGWLFFMLMNLGMAGLMYTQAKPLLMVQQLVSLCFVLYGFNKARK